MTVIGRRHEAIDANGNPTDIADATGFDSKQLSYDNLDRLKTASVNAGYAAMAHDAPDNLTQYKLGTRDWRYSVNGSASENTAGFWVQPEPCLSTLDRVWIACAR